jgi:excinuclease ABC subunit A
VDQITGLSPAISIQQKTGGWNPRSTVGTITQIHDYVRVLFARVGKQHCPQCGKPIAAQSREQIISRLLEIPAGTKIQLLGPVVHGQKGEYRDLFEDMLRQGYARARVDGQIVSLSDPPALARHMRHDIEIVVDRLTISGGVRPRLAEAVEQALKLGGGTLIVQPIADDERLRDSSGTPGASAGSDFRDANRRPSAVESKNRERGTKRTSSRKRLTAATAGDLLLSSHYACTNCDYDPRLLVPDPKKSFLAGAIEPMRTPIGKWRRHIYRGVADRVGFDLQTPWNKLSKAARDALLNGLGDTHIAFEWRYRGGVWRHGGTFDGVIAELREKHRKAKSNMVRAYYEKYMRQAQCVECGGARLNDQARAVRLCGKTVTEVSAMSILEAVAYFESLKFTDRERLIARDVIKEIVGRLTFLCDVGLEYLTLDRAAPTLSGGESQRIRLASQIGAGLVGVLYILDEPSIGLHARDNERLLDSLCRLRDMGNTVIVVEHDEQTMRRADEIVDFGPGPGVRGGEVVARGDLEKIKRSRRSVTGKYLRGQEEIAVPKERRPVKA